MNIQSVDILGNSSIGIFGVSTDTYSLFPYNIQSHKMELIEETLETKIVTTTINNSNLLGLFAVGTSDKLLIPNLTNLDEFNKINQELGDNIEIHRFDSTITALGNVIVVIKDKALVSPEFTKSEINQIADLLDVEVQSRSILNTSIVGSLMFGNHQGLLVHPLVSDEELDWLESYFRVPVDVVTVNRGTPYPRPGIIGNSKGVLVGSDTTGPELMRIFEVLLT
ncbi:MAG: translation initiation factor IF-6 [Candidatus Kariarchaeaceae archaeon]|jgi:translation initiation factor 6